MVCVKFAQNRASGSSFITFFLFNMCGKSGIMSKITAFVLTSTNFISMILCIVVFAFSLWIIASPQTLVNTIQLFGNSTFNLLFLKEFVLDVTVQAGITGAVVAGFVFFISAMGFYGAVTGSRFLLFMYATLVVLLLLLECSLMYYFSSNIVEKGLQEQDSIINHALRIAFHCCERNYTASEAMPRSCCDVTLFTNCTADNIYKKDCKQEFTSWLNKYQILVYVMLAVIHLLLSSCSLLRRAYSASHSHT